MVHEMRFLRPASAMAILRDRAFALAQNQGDLRATQSMPMSQDKHLLLRRRQACESGMEGTPTWCGAHADVRSARVHVTIHPGNPMS